MKRSEISVKIPTVHMNGTSYQDLFDEAMDARSGLRNGLDLLRRMAPNNRDYYVQGPDALTAAQEQHHARCKAVQDVNEQVEQIIMGIADQEPAGRSR